MAKWLARLTRQVRYWREREQREQALREEMDFHLEAMTRSLVEGGMKEEEAREAARRKFGNVTQKAEESRGTWIKQWWNDAGQDLRYGVRMLGKDAGFTTFAVLIVGLGIGASATVFSILNALLLRPLPFEDPGRLVWVANSGKDGLSAQTVQVGHLLDLREQNQSFSELAAYFAFYGVGDDKLTGDGEPERLTTIPVSGNFFPVLGVRPLIGRPFTEEECKWNGPKAVLLSEGLWRRRFGGDRGVVGRQLTLNDAPVTVVGVMPETFDFGAIFAPGSRIDAFVPFPLSAETNRWGNTLAIIGRLKPGLTVEGAQAEASVICPRIERQHPERNTFDARMSPLEEHVSGRLRPALLVLAGAVGVVMLIVCANLSNLQLARTATRQKEMAIRVALGAGRKRLIRQMLTESVVLSCCGAALGLVLAVGGTKILAGLDAISIPLLGSVRVDGRALGFTVFVAVASGLLFGLTPALHLPVAVHESLKDSNRGSSGGKRHTWIRSVLVVSEIAFACVLLVGAGLLIRSLLRVLEVNLGFQPERAAAIRIDPSRTQYKTQVQRNGYFDEALRRVKAIPGIEAAGLTDVLPLGRNRSWGVGAKGQVYSKEHPYPDAFVRIVSDGYLRTMGIPLREGRDLSEQDGAGSDRVVLVNESLARRMWPGESALGKILRADGERRVVGVVGDVRHLALEKGSGLEMYLPIRQTSDYPSVDLVVRTTLPPAGLAAAVREALRPIEPNLPANEFRTLQQLVDRAVSPRRVVVVLLGGFAGFALMLASLGIYGVISYSVNRRTQEIGIRMALGASGGELQKRILRETLGLAGIGMGFGIAASWVVAKALQGMLYGVEATDPVTFAGMLAVLTLVAGLAGYVPARRASQVDPMMALRGD